MEKINIVIPMAGQAHRTMEFWEVAPHPLRKNRMRGNLGLGL